MEDLRTKYKRLLEGAVPAGPPQVVDPTQGAVDPTTGEQLPPAQTTDPAVVAPNQAQQDPSPLGGGITAPHFPSNQHRFSFQAGEAVAYYNDAGKLVAGTIEGPPIGDKYQVATQGGSERASVLKSELFYATQ